MLEDLKVLYALSRFFWYTGFDFLTRRSLCAAVKQLMPSFLRPRLKPKASNDYLIRTYTSDVAFGGTDSFIKIRLIDEENTSSAWFKLDNPDKNDFQRGAIDEFLISTLSLKKIKVIQVLNQGGGVGAAWRVDKIDVIHREYSLEFPVFSWIEPTDDLDAARCFFDSESMFFENTIDCLKQYRLRELSRCQSLYDFDIYNDLSKGDQLRAPLTIYMRRQKGNDASLPLDERFRWTKTKGFALNVIAGTLPRAILNILTTQTADNTVSTLHNVDWYKYYHLKQAYWLMCPLYYYVPAISKRWKEDLEFGRQRLAGVNPVFITRLNLNDEILKTAKVTQQTVRALLPTGYDLNSETLKGKIYYVDYRKILTEEWRAKFNSDKRHVSSPIAFFYVNDKKQLMPLAIQLEPDQDPFTPNDKEEDWIIAKIHFAAADSGVHQLYTHYTRAHASSEVFSIALRRQLHQTHPVYKLLRPHLRYTMAINSKARAKLINADGHVERAFYTGASTMNFAEFAYANFYQFDAGALPKDLKARGVNNHEALPHYPYRDDGLEVWHAIKHMIKSFLQVYYPEDEVDPTTKKSTRNLTVINDTELQGWYRDATTRGHYNKTFKPLNNLKRLIKTLAIIIWTATAHHACVNFCQYEITSYGLNQPPHCRLPAVRGTGTEEKVMRTIPDLMTNCLVISVTKTLSSYAAKGEEEYLGTTQEKLIYENAAIQVMRDFNHRLTIVEANIKARDLDRYAVYGVRYPYLLPSKIANSVAI